MTGGVSDIKHVLRRQLRFERDALENEHRVACAERASRFIIDHTLWESAHVVASYLPHESEFDPTVIARSAIAKSKKLVFPRVVGKHLEFHSWREGDAVEATVGGVLQPLASAAPCATDDIELFLTPLLGCGIRPVRHWHAVLRCGTSRDPVGSAPSEGHDRVGSRSGAGSSG